MLRHIFAAFCRESPSAHSAPVSSGLLIRDKGFNQRLLEYYKECYYFENEQKDKVAGRVTWFLAVLGLLANICLYYLQHHPTLEFAVPTLTFWILFSAGVITAMVGMYYCIRLVGLPFSGHSYGYVPTPLEVQDFVERAEAYNANLASVDKIDLNNVFEEFLMKQFCECASANARRNHSRNEYGYFANSWCIVSFGLLLLAGVPFTVAEKALPNSTVQSNVSMGTTTTVSDKKSAKPEPNASDVASKIDVPPNIDIGNLPIKLQPTRPQFPSIMWLTEANEKDFAKREREEH